MAYSKKKTTKNVQAIFSAQKACIKALRANMDIFFKNEKKGSIKIFPLAIPTGWGKTRVTIRSILEAKCNSTVVLWPQRDSHTKEIWSSNYNWLRFIPKNAEENKSFNYWKKIGGEGIVPLPKIEGLQSSKTKKTFRHSFFYVNGSFNKGAQSIYTLYKKNENASKNLVFVIDEWHSKRILEAFQNSGLDAIEFWKTFLFGKNKYFEKLKTFVLLVSATPIASTARMDSVKDDLDDEKYELSIKKSMEGFFELVGGDRNISKIQKIYDSPIKSAVSRLVNERKSKVEHPSHGDKWAKEYVELYRNSKVQNFASHMVYANEQALFWHSTLKHWDDEKSSFEKGAMNFNVSLKQQTLVSFLKKHRMVSKNVRQKFVIFCHHIKIAEKLTAYLNTQKSLKAAVDGKMQDCAYYLNGEPSKNDLKFQSFAEKNVNNLKGNHERIFYLIVTDKHSQGISFHKSEAWLIHYELSWNPIRIIQRFGRVWRILKSGQAHKESLKLTKPVAFYVPYTYSSEEEQIHRLMRRWKILKDIQDNSPLGLNLLPLDYEIALGCRITPEP